MIECIKCLVWDLDNTIWSGTLVESDSCTLRYGIKTILSTLDKRGILMSIASSNDKDLAVTRLKDNGIYGFFLYPQIGWANKVGYIKTIADKLRISFDGLGFIDDEPFQLEQVRQHLPSVRTYPAEEYKALLEKPEFSQPFHTRESSQRRQCYIQEAFKTNNQNRFQITQRAFLKSCRTQMTIRRADQSDLPRMLELMHRTHQLNATGIVYRENQIQSFLKQSNYRIYLAELRDRFTDYGRIGIAICRCRPSKIILLSFLLSCRISGRGIGHFFLSWLQARAFQEGMIEMVGHYIKQQKNDRMYLLYKLAGFKMTKEQKNGPTLFTKQCNQSYKIPEWLSLNDEDGIHGAPAHTSH